MATPFDLRRWWIVFRTASMSSKAGWLRIGCDSTLQKPRSSGWGHDRLCNTARNLLCLYPVRSSLHLHRLEISASLWILNFPWLIMSTIWSRSVRSNYVNYAWFAVHSISMPRTHSFVRSYIVVWTIVTASSQECRTICSDDYRQSWTRLLVFSSSCPVGKVYQSGCATSCIGYVSHSGSHTNCACWRSRRSTIRLRSTWCDVAFGFHPTRVELVWGQPPPVNSSCRELPRKLSATGLSQAQDPSHETVCPV